MIGQRRRRATGGTGLALAALAGFVGVLAGCSQPILLDEGELRLTRRDADPARTAPVVLFDNRTTALYRFRDLNDVTILFIQGPVDRPRRVTALTMIWKPTAGATPVDRTATNTAIRCLAFRDSPDQRDAVGVYGGGGFMRLHTDPALGRITGTLLESDVRLIDRSEGFVDAWGRAGVTGTFTADRDDAAVTTILRGLHPRLEDRLGYPRLVGGGRPRGPVSIRFNGTQPRAGLALGR
ncbi:MAG: hypothetical protein AAF710_09150 [Planctomycetota bacterium]